MLHGLHALIIEDEIIAGVGMQLVLSELGFESFAFAGTANQALEQALIRTPDLVTVDVRLLDGDGVAAAREIRRVIGPSPTVFVTGDPRALADQADAVVVEKPYGPADMASAYKRAREMSAREINA
jgi:CheY-like chemotaxis protein